VGQNQFSRAADMLGEQAYDRLPSSLDPLATAGHRLVCAFTTDVIQI
jgi:hypothetical protein